MVKLPRLIVFFAIYVCCELELGERSSAFGVLYLLGCQVGGGGNVDLLGLGFDRFS